VVGVAVAAERHGRRHPQDEGRDLYVVRHRPVPRRDPVEHHGYRRRRVQGTDPRGAAVRHRS
jgi:hypothetical protein